MKIGVVKREDVEKLCGDARAFTFSVRSGTNAAFGSLK
jgi:hypothetical protein